MKNYTTKPVPVEAEQYTGTKKSIDSIKAGFAINHDHVVHDDKGEIQSWSVGNGPRALQPVPFNGWFVIDASKKVNILTDEAFTANFDPAK